MGSAGGHGDEPPHGLPDARMPGRPVRDQPQGTGQPRRASPADPGSYQQSAGDRRPADSSAPPLRGRAAVARGATAPGGPRPPLGEPMPGGTTGPATDTGPTRPPRRSGAPGAATGPPPALPPRGGPPRGGPPREGAQRGGTGPLLPRDWPPHDGPQRGGTGPSPALPPRDGPQRDRPPGGPQRGATGGRPPRQALPPPWPRPPVAGRRERGHSPAAPGRPRHYHLRTTTWRHLPARAEFPARAVPVGSYPLRSCAAARAFLLPRQFLLPRGCFLPENRLGGRHLHPGGRLARGLTSAEGPDPGLPAHAGSARPDLPTRPVLRVEPAVRPRIMAGRERQRRRLVGKRSPAGVLGPGHQRPIGGRDGDPDLGRDG